ncbi:MAG TPA: hypothetical protein IGS17_06225 [Oscillatoriales cyanobacterium M59_W2019_021]|nr:MAG: hypothetical protein D6728_19640 [Cyanobacteria bacterium J055]HIK30563.1 hypothetical protein [Oscillatoriales cyanobacterium M4454_W2019_049]HIK50508.1 hypothetical protein [Oscillatoriales cyanobacterium M59_W2019_021]
MDVWEAIKLVDAIVFSQTGEHLDDLQAGIVEGVLKRKKYTDIAKSYECTEGHVKDISYNLWHILSTALGEQVNKKNLKTTLLRHGCLNIWGGTFSESNVIGNVQFCGSISQKQIVNESPDFSRGKHQEKIEIAVKLRQRGWDDLQIIELLGLSPEDIQNI